MTLEKKLQGLKKDFARKAPERAQEIMADAIRGLEQSGILERVVRPGEPFVDFCLPDASASQVCSRSLRAEGPLVLCFYRGHW